MLDPVLRRLGIFNVYINVSTDTSIGLLLKIGTRFNVAHAAPKHEGAPHGEGRVCESQPLLQAIPIHLHDMTASRSSAISGFRSPIRSPPFFLALFLGYSLLCRSASSLGQGYS